MRGLELALLLTAAAGLAQAQSVSVSGMLGPKALIVIDGGTPRALAPGESYQGIKVIATRGDMARVEIDGRPHELRVGATPVSIGPGPNAQRIVLTADGSGHFFTQGSINQKPAPMLIDTGASVVTLSEMVARQLGLSYQDGRRAMATTANGPAFGWLIKIDQLGVGDTVTRGVDAVVIPGELPMVLLGNNFLSGFSMRRDADRMTLLRR